MEEFICDLLGVSKEDFTWFYMLNQKYHVIDKYASVFDLLLECGYDSNIIYGSSLNTYWAEGAILTAIIRNEIDETFDLSDGICTTEELLSATDNGKYPINVYYNTPDVSEDTFNKFSKLIKELGKLRNKFDNLVCKNTSFGYASATRRR